MVPHVASDVRVEFLLKTDSGYPKDTGVNKPWCHMLLPMSFLSQVEERPSR